MSDIWNDNKWKYWTGDVRDSPTDLDYKAFKREIDDEMRRLHKRAAADVFGPVNAPTGASSPDACQGQSEPAKLYCPAHGKISSHLGDTPIYLMGRRYCPHCLAQGLERIGVHALVEKAPKQEKKW